MRTNTASCVFAVILVALAATACQTVPAPRPEPTEDLSAPGASLSVVELRPDVSTPAALSARASGIAAVLAGTQVPTVAPEEVARAFSATPGRAELLVESGERIRVHVDVARSEMLAVSGAVVDDYTSSADIGPARARARFEEALKALATGRFVEPDGLSEGGVRTGRLMQSETRRGEQTTSRVKEYVFEAPRIVDGVEVFGANVTVDVHRSGRIASIRTVGPVVTRTGEVFKRTLSAASLTEHARKDNPGAEVVPVGLRYAWNVSVGDSKLALRPRETFRVTPVTEVEGQTIHGRSHYVFYAVDNDKEPPIVWPRPNPEAIGDTRK